MIYEERRIRLRPGQFGAYRDWVLQELWQQLTADGHDPLCLLNGMIGHEVSDVILIIGFENTNSWQSAQGLIAGDGRDARPRAWVESEQVKLLSASEFRPTGPAQEEHRRPVYGLRRWWIQPEDWREFNRLSYEGIWPALDHMGHHVLGQFRDLATTSPLEIMNLAGYHDVAHWQATRRPDQHGVPDDLLEKFRTLGRDRGPLVLKSFVSLMAAHWPSSQ